MSTFTNFVQPATALPLVWGGVGKVTSNMISLAGMTNADVIDLFTLPAGSKPLSATVKIYESAGETCTFNLGITGGDVDGLAAGVNMNQAAGTIVEGAGDDMPAAVTNAAATLISAVIASGTTFTAGKFTVTVVYTCSQA